LSFWLFAASWAPVDTLVTSFFSKFCFPLHGVLPPPFPVGRPRRCWSLCCQIFFGVWSFLWCSFPPFETDPSFPRFFPLCWSFLSEMFVPGVKLVDCLTATSDSQARCFLPFFFSLPVVFLFSVPLMCHGCVELFVWISLLTKSVEPVALSAGPVSYRFCPPHFMVQGASSKPFLLAVVEHPGRGDFLFLVLHHARFFHSAALSVWHFFMFLFFPPPQSPFLIVRSVA